MAHSLHLDFYGRLAQGSAKGDAKGSAKGDAKGWGEAKGASKGGAKGEAKGWGAAAVAPPAFFGIRLACFCIRRLIHGFCDC